jgi:putative tryptophan/tyrosine transport system substrate-binding protein
VDRRTFVAATGSLLGILASPATAQRKTPVVGLLWNDSVKPSPYVQVLIAALGEKGYAVPRDLRIEDRVGVEGYSGYDQGAADLVRTKVDVIVASGTTALQAAAKATKDIPIVMISGLDPVALGFAASLSRPGGNITGVSTLTVGLAGKRIELLKELVPGLTRVGVLLAPNLANQTNRRESEAAARTLNLQVHFVEVRTIDEVESRVAELLQARVDAVSVTAATLLSSHSPRVVTAIAKHRLPAVYANERYAESGGLMTYAASGTRAFVRAAGYVDRILKGARPGELAIDQQREVELTVNLKTARALGIKVPQAVLVRADRVIE